MSKTLKAIETRYRDYRFRSRTEARWAVFFDSLGVRYEYEKEGYELPSGRYLPDFWLPQANIWFEVKGGVPDAAEVNLMRELFVATESPGLISHGAPTSGVKLTLVSWLFQSDPAKVAGCGVSLHMTDYARGKPMLRGAAIPATLGVITNFKGSGSAIRGSSLVLGVAADPDEIHGEMKIGGGLKIGAEVEYTPKALRSIVRKLQGAHKDAMGARFEHGESGAQSAPHNQPTAAQAA